MDIVRDSSHILIYTKYIYFQYEYGAYVCFHITLPNDKEYSLYYHSKSFMDECKRMRWNDAGVGKKRFQVESLEEWKRWGKK